MAPSNNIQTPSRSPLEVEVDPLINSVDSIHLSLEYTHSPTGSPPKSNERCTPPQSPEGQCGSRPGPPSNNIDNKKKSKVRPDHVPDWSNLQVIHRNTLPPRSHFFTYDSERDALSFDVTRARSFLLSGTWGFHLTQGPFNGPADFWDPAFDTSKWDLVKVPGMWQCQGFGKGPQYTNVNYPFPVDPPHVSYDDNECGRYVTKFQVPDRLKKGGDQWRLRFEGVDAAFTVWLNGTEIGYSQGSRNPSEFDVTQALNLDSDENYLAVKVYQRCDGSYIEDQGELLHLSRIIKFMHTYYRQVQQSPTCNPIYTPTCP